MKMKISLIIHPFQMEMKISLIIHPFQNGNKNIPFYPSFVKFDIEHQETKAITNLSKKIRNSSHFSAISYQICGQMSLFIDFHNKYVSKL